MKVSSGIAALRLDSNATERFLLSVHSREPISGLTHNFYRYPARFSPQFARAAIETFTQPGDVVLDPFMGGATTLVEARVLARTGIGLDINELSCFVARAKTTSLTEADIRAVRLWMRVTISNLSMRRAAKRPDEWIEAGYQRNVSTRQTWPIRKALELALHRVSLLKSNSQQNFVRAVLLRTGQWTLDCRSDVPSVAHFRNKFAEFLEEMIEGVREYRNLESTNGNGQSASTLILHRSAQGIEEEPAIAEYGPPKLVLTSPPYPGVHVIYHRWQVLGRKETPAPFWITNTLDGSGSSYYTFGDRKNPNLKTYFDRAQATFRSIAQIANRETLIVQLVAFAQPSWQLPTYLETMAAAGLVEFKIPCFSNSRDGRLWRVVPNRKWYAEQRGPGGAGKEVVLFHRAK
jgi:DNA methylase